jgi:hypothetical protein
MFHVLRPALSPSLAIHSKCRIFRPFTSSAMPESKAAELTGPLIGTHKYA